MTDDRDLETKRRQAILVLGMHRSGTSAVAGVMAGLGASAPKTQMAADEHNAKGYLESTAIHEFNDRILASAGSNWRDWEPFDPHWMDSPFAAGFAAEFPDLIQSEFGDAKTLLVKDPRICRLVPFWVEQLRAIDVEPKAILVVRHPLEVASSLAKRNSFSLRVSLLIWLRYLLDAELHSREIGRTWVHYDDLLADWRGTVDHIEADLRLDFRPRTGDVEREIDDFVSPSLQHHVSPIDDLLAREDVFEWVKAAYRAVNDRVARRRNESETQAALDRIRDNFDTACEIYRPLVCTEFHQAIADLERISGELHFHMRRYAKEAKKVKDLTTALRKSGLRWRLLHWAGHLRNAGYQVLGLQKTVEAPKNAEEPKKEPTNVEPPKETKAREDVKVTPGKDQPPGGAKDSTIDPKDVLGRTPNSFASYVSIGAADKSFRDISQAIAPNFAQSRETFPDETKLTRSSAQIAVVCHVYYLDLWQELAEQIAHISAPFDLYVTISDQAGATELAEQIAKRFAGADVRILLNQGRDILPFVSVLNAHALDGYYLVCKIHTKKSPHRFDGSYWRRKLVFGVLGSAENIKDILRGFNADPQLGMVVANGEIYEGDKGWLGNRSRCEELATTLGLALSDYPSRFACGSIFWCRGNALKPLKELSLTAASFEPETGSVDGTLAHAIERLFSIFAMSEGYRVMERSQI
jgi:hypothetical protein